MKNNKVIPLIISGLLSASVLTGCSFGKSDSSTSKNDQNTSSEISLEKAIQDGILELEQYPNYDNYRKNEKQEVLKIVEQGKKSIETATNVNAIKYLLITYKGMIDEVPTKDTFPAWEQDDFLDYKNDAKIELSCYRKPENYRQAEQKQLSDLVEEGCKNIDGCRTREDISSTLSLYKSKIDLLKTKQQYEDEEAGMIKLEDCNGTDQIKKYKAQGYSNLYQDPNYKDGYIVTKPFYGQGESPYHSNYLRTYSSLNKPTWTIAQWTSRYDLLGTNEETDGYQVHRETFGLVNTYTSKGKVHNGVYKPAKVITANSVTGSLYLESNCSVEYEKVRQDGDGWVHLLYSQDFGNNLINIKNCKSIVMDCEYTINKCENWTGDAYNKNKHAAQLVWYLTLQNRNRSSKGYGKYIWFGIALWDNRTEGKISNEYIAHDAGTDTLIYNPASTAFLQETNGFHSKIGEKAHANIEIRAIAEKAFSDAQAKGYLENTNFEDLCFGGTNFGYEVPGIFDIASTIHCINVFYK